MEFQCVCVCVRVLPARCVWKADSLVVGVLSPIVVDIVEGAEVAGSIRMEALHDLICNATHLVDGERDGELGISVGGGDIGF